jgi:hypothetical protein
MPQVPGGAASGLSRPARAESLPMLGAWLDGVPLPPPVLRAQRC